MEINDIIDDVMQDAMIEMRNAMFTAMRSGMTIAEVCDMARHASTPIDFVDAVTMYANAMPDDMWGIG